MGNKMHNMPKNMQNMEANMQQYARKNAEYGKKYAAICRTICRIWQKIVQLNMQNMQRPYHGILGIFLHIATCNICRIYTVNYYFAYYFAYICKSLHTYAI